MALRKVNTATLIRGKVYSFRHPDSSPQKPLDSLRFERGVPKIIEDSRILNLLEDLTEEIGDGEGELYDKPVFRVDRGVDAPDGEPVSKVSKLSSTRVVKKKPIRR